MADLWEMNWMEANPLFTYITLALIPREAVLAHREEARRLANETLRLYPTDRVLRPVMNSLRRDLATNPFADRMHQEHATKPIPINERPLDNEYAWKSNPYQMDGWLKPAITALAFSCDDPQVAWFSDSTGRIYITRDAMKSWQDMSPGLMGARVKNIAASGSHTFVLYAETDRGPVLTRDGGLNWHSAADETLPAFGERNFAAWQKNGAFELRIDDQKRLLPRTAQGDGEPAMDGWRIPLATSIFITATGAVAGGPCGAYASDDGKTWKELPFWPEYETGSCCGLPARLLDGPLLPLHTVTGEWICDVA